MEPMQYAQLPKFEYQNFQTFEPRYQSFNLNTFSYSYYSIPSPSDPLTPEKTQDNNPPPADQDPPPSNGPDEGSTTAPDDGSSSPDAASMYLLL